MAERVHHATARKLATKAEWTVLESSFGTALTDLTAARLEQKMARAKAMRDKHPRNSEERAMFAQALERFAEQGAKLKKRTDATKKPATNGKTAPRKKAVAKRAPKKQHRSVMLAVPATAPTEPPAGAAEPTNPWEAFDPGTAIAKQMHSEESRGARKDQSLLHQNAIAHQAHIGSRARRNQAKRDSR